MNNMEDFENSIMNDILDSIDLNNKPELMWSVTFSGVDTFEFFKYDIEGFTFNRKKDGLVLLLPSKAKGNGEQYYGQCSILEPTIYSFKNKDIEQLINNRLSLLLTYLNNIKNEKKEKDKVNRLKYFFKIK
jgi:hypothetical protein